MVFAAKQLLSSRKPMRFVVFAIPNVEGCEKLLGELPENNPTPQSRNTAVLELGFLTNELDVEQLLLLGKIGRRRGRKILSPAGNNRRF